MSPETIGRRRKAVMATLTAGVIVMVVFDHWSTLILGIVLMLGSVVAGVFLVAIPDGFLDHDSTGTEEDHGRTARGAEPGPGS